MKLIYPSAMKLMSVVGLIFIPYNTAESNLKGTKENNGKKKFDGDDCSLHVGDRHDGDTRHRRMVSVNLLPERCEQSDTVSVDAPHDGTKRSFKKVKSNPRQQENHKGFGSWYGEDATDGATFNYVQDENGNIHGSLVDVKSHTVMQFSVEDGNPIVIITDSSDFLPELDAPEEKDNDTGDRDLLSDVTQELESSSYSNLRMNNNPPQRRQNQGPQGSPEAAVYDDNGGNLDVMVVWTHKAECKNFGLSEGCTLTDQTTAAMEGLINLAIEETNTAFELSGVETQLFLAHSYRHLTYNETLVQITHTLKALRNGEISGTEQNRERYGADIVAMIADNEYFCGISIHGPKIDKMYSVTSWKCATGYFSFGHEIGHNLGLKHDRGTEYDCDSDKYNFGYRDPQARFRTILAYDCTKNQCDNNHGGKCSRIQRYSNPSITYGEESLPVGTPSSNNVRKLNDVRTKVAKYFPHGGTGVATPTQSPALSQSSPQPSVSCNDSPLEFIYQKQFMNCGALMNSMHLCSDTEIQAICPGTCRTCFNCVDPPTLTFNYFNTAKNKWQTKGCKVVQKFSTKRCQFFGVSDTCRATCGTC